MKKFYLISFLIIGKLLQLMTFLQIILFHIFFETFFIEFILLNHWFLALQLKKFLQNTFFDYFSNLFYFFVQLIFFQHYSGLIFDFIAKIFYYFSEIITNFLLILTFVSLIQLFLSISRIEQSIDAPILYVLSAMISKHSLLNLKQLKMEYFTHSIKFKMAF